MFRYYVSLIFRFFRMAGRIFLFLLLTLICLEYFRSLQFDFHPPHAFSGPAVYNPYQQMGTRWLKANFHAHSIAWGGLANGHQQPAAIRSYYRMHGYDIACISNYNQISRDPDIPAAEFIPVYEHGWNTGKVHQLVIGSASVQYYDCPLKQSCNNMQYVLDLLNEKGGLICLNHPGVRDAYDSATLSKLTGYQLMEVLSRRKDAEKNWDWALSAGKLCWALGNDDCHDLRDPEDMLNSWTMVNAPDKSAATVLHSLKTGNFYAVLGFKQTEHSQLRAVTLFNDTIRVSLSRPALRIQFIGQNGKVLASVQNTGGASFYFSKTFSYVRVQAEFDDCRILLNPFIRFDGKQVPYNDASASVNRKATWLNRAEWLLIWLVSVFILSGKTILRLSRQFQSGFMPEYLPAEYLPAPVIPEPPVS